MTNKIFRAGVQLSTIVVSLCMIFILMSLYAYLNREQEKRLADEMKFLEAGFQLNGLSYLETLEEGDFRVTLVHENGAVLFDSKGDKAVMENHLNREEIKNAFLKGIGKSQRTSTTLLQKNTYLAKKQADGTVLRVSTTTISPGGLVLAMMTEMAAVLFISLLLAVFLSSKLAKNIVKPINSLNLDETDKNGIYEELSPLLRKIEKQKKDIESQIERIKQKNDEFLQVIGCMHEGLVLLDRERRILSMNKAAKQFFSIGEEWIGKDFLYLSRDFKLKEMMDKAEEKGKSKFFMDKGNRKYQLNLSRLLSGEERIGTAIIIFDVSERALAEKSRREFSANVSHELKTPLQSIMGSAELLEHKLVKKEDEAEFMAKIRAEAGRLLSLIEDIIKLSQLDEGRGLETEAVKLPEVAEEVLFLLREKAEKAEVHLKLSEEEKDIILSGNRAMLTDIIYNLCDNGIKYNKKGGEVCISLSETKEEVEISVKDTGIGISAEHRDRVFERFYCVDKSRSKKTGGTGLGLAIVKHTVGLLGGRIELISEVDKGTEVIIRFPKEKSLS